MQKALTILKAMIGKKSMIKKIFLLFLIFPSFSLAQSPSYQSLFSGFGMHGIMAYVGAGFANFQVKNPTSNMTMNPGVYVYTGVERRISDSAFFITGTFNYMKSSGQTIYNYTNLSGVNYAGNNIGFDSTSYQLSLGAKLKLFADGWARPYIEGGGIFGYHQMTYTTNLPSITMTGAGNANDYLKNDSMTGLGYYAEGGIEVDFADTMGLRAGGRYQDTTTQAFKTLGGQKVEFTATIIQIAFLKKF